MLNAEITLALLFIGFKNNIFMKKISLDSNNKVLIPNDGKKKFTPNVSLKHESIMSCVDFAAKMAYGEGYHNPHAFGAISYSRENEEIFKNTLQGKIAELAFYNLMCKLNIKPDALPDFQVWGKGKWEDCDFTFKTGEIKVSVKSTKNFGNLLLLEKDRYNALGEFLEPVDDNTPVKYDYIFLARVKGVDVCDLEYYKEFGKNIEVEITGYLSNGKFKELILDKQIIKKGCIIGIPMLVDNYYACASDLKPAEYFGSENF